MRAQPLIGLQYLSLMRAGPLNGVRGNDPRTNVISFFELPGASFPSICIG